MRVLYLILLLVFSGCTNADWAQWGALGSSGHIVCFSGGQKIYEGDSTGKISTEHNSDGWYFQEKGSGSLIRISGTCIIRN